MNLSKVQKLIAKRVTRGELEECFRRMGGPYEENAQGESTEYLVGIIVCNRLRFLFDNANCKDGAYQTFTDQQAADFVCGMEFFCCKRGVNITSEYYVAGSKMYDWYEIKEMTERCDFHMFDAMAHAEDILRLDTEFRTKYGVAWSRYMTILPTMKK